MNKYLPIVAISIGAAFSSCRPANIPKVEQIAPNETAFLIPLEGDAQGQVKFDSEGFLEKNKISIGRVEIPHRWRSTGYFWLSGEYIPTVALIKVDRAPVTCRWETPVDKDGRAIANSKGDNSVWVESKDSVGFSIGFNVSAYIEAQNASTFLYIYAGRPLKDVIDTEVHGRVLEVAQGFASQYIMDDLREKKGEMSVEIQKDVTEFFKNRGITVTNLGISGGFCYENLEIQASIDKVFVTQQMKNTTKATLEAQNSINEKLVSEAEAAAKAAEQKAQGAAKAMLIEAKAKAEALALEAEALQKVASNPLYLETQRLSVVREFNTKWDGKLPTSYIGNDKVTTLMGIPDLNTGKITTVAQ